jgi:uncharacterized repeat protein (TIGR01451 family)
MRLSALTFALFASTASAQTVEVLSPANPPSLSGTGAADAVVVSPDDRTVYVETTSAVLGAPLVGTLYAYDVASGVPSSLGGNATPRAVSADGRVLAVETSDPELVPGAVQPQVVAIEPATGARWLVSHAAGNPDQPTNGQCRVTAVSEDGRFVLFDSVGTNLVPGQVDPSFSTYDVFLYDRATGLNTLLSGTGSQASSLGSYSWSLSPDGRWVALVVATFQGPGGTATKVILWDRVTGSREIVDHLPGSPNSASGLSQRPGVSADGAWVAFDSNAGSLVPGLGSPIPVSVFLYERATGLVSLVSRASGSTGAANGASSRARISPDGGTIAYASAATNLVAGQVDANGGEDAFAFDRTSGATRLLSHAAGTPSVASNGVIAPDSIVLGTGYATFRSRATDLVAGQLDGNGDHDLFAAELGSDTVRLLSHRAGSAVATGNAPVSASATSSTGWTSAFLSAASDLTADTDANGAADPFLAHPGSSQTRRVTVQDPSRLRLTANDDSDLRADFIPDPGSSWLSLDGRVTVFTSEATDLVEGQLDDAGSRDVFLFDRALGRVTLVSHAASFPELAVGGEKPLVSADGRFVLFVSPSSQVVAGQVDPVLTSDVFLFDRLSGQSTLVSHAVGSPVTAADFSSSSGAPSADGAFVAFTSGATNLVAGQVDGNGQSDVFVFERATGAITLQSHVAGAPNQTGSSRSEEPTISADGRFVAFLSLSPDLVAGQVDTNLTSDVFLADRQLGGVRLVSHRHDAPLTTASEGSGGMIVSADGSRVAFFSGSDELVPGQVNTPDDSNIFLWDRSTDTSTMVTHAAGTPTTAANDSSSFFSLSADGRFVGYRSTATNLVAGQIDTNEAEDAFLYDAATHTSRLVSHAFGSESTAGNAPSPPLPTFYRTPPAVSADGLRVVFASAASDILANGQLYSSVYVFDAATGGNTLASPGLQGGQARFGFPAWSFVSGDGNFVLFADSTFDLVPGDTNASTDVFLFGPVHTQANLRVTMTDSADPVATGQAFAYALSVENVGGTNATGVTLTVALPAGVSFTSALPGRPTCVATGDVVQCALGPLAAGASVPVTIDVTATAPSGLLSCAARVVAVEPDIDRSDDEAVETTAVEPADVVLSMDGPSAAVPAGVPYAYALSVTNDGPSPASGVTLSDTLPPGLTFVSSTPGPPTCTHAAGVFTCDAGPLAPGASFAASLTVQPAGYTAVTNEATASAASHDPDLANNVARVTTALAPGFGAELGHGSVLRRDLAALPGPSVHADRFRLAQPAYTSWEVSVDGASGDVSAPGGAVALERLASDASTLLQTATAPGTGHAVRLAIENATDGALVDEVVRVRSTGCGVDCGPDDVYRIRARETTATIPRFNNTATQATVLLLQNREPTAIDGHVWFWSPAGTLLASRSFALAPRGSFVLATAALPGLSGSSGSITVTHDGPYGALAGKAVALEPATGFAFDAPLSVRPR